jgi:hypothetical protein
MVVESGLLYVVVMYNSWVMVLGFEQIPVPKKESVALSLKPQ